MQSTVNSDWCVFEECVTEFRGAWGRGAFLGTDVLSKGVKRGGGHDRRQAGTDFSGGGGESSMNAQVGGGKRGGIMRGGGGGVGPAKAYLFPPFIVLVVHEGGREGGALEKLPLEGSPGLFA